ncbi:acyltransferase [Telmatocola sphagniphila]|uniref:Acyltransferase n=1 Tax=Telmatocola sphagniphila TaxID=1123043 RepID=A0A8E6EZJ1_9BACT|nr:acyltransferase [Telmatocola sphagniphila]
MTPSDNTQNRTDNLKREPRSDLLKAAAIYGVVAIHTPGPEDDLTSCFRFCVPVFIILWAMHYELGLSKRSPVQARRYVMNRLISLAFPYSIWTAIYLFLFHTREQWLNTPYTTIANGWLGGYGWPGQYYFVVLFQLTVIFPFFRGIFQSRLLYPILILGLIVTLISEAFLWKFHFVSGMGDRLFVYWIPYLALGITLSRPPIPSLLPNFLMVIISIIALSVCKYEQAWLASQSDRASPYILVSVYVGSIFLAWASFFRSRQTELFTTKVVTAIEFVGRNTFPIFLLNPLVIYLLPPEIAAPIHNNSGIAKHYILAMLVLIICLCLARVLRWLRMGSFIGT